MKETLKEDRYNPLTDDNIFKCEYGHHLINENTEILQFGGVRGCKDCSKKYMQSVLDGKEK